MTADVQGWTAIPNWIARDPRVSTNAKAVYMALSSRLGREGVVIPKHSTIAAEMGMSVSTVRRALRELRELGVLSWEPQHREDGSQSSNAYAILAHPFAPPTPPKGGGVVTGEQGGVVTGEQGGWSPVNSQEEDSLEEDSLEEQPPPTSSTESRGVSSARQVHNEPRPLPDDWRPRWRPDQHTWDWAVTNIEHYGVDLAEVAENMVLWARDKERLPSGDLYRTFLVTARDRIIEMENKLNRWEQPKDTRDGWARTYNVAQ